MSIPILLEEMTLGEIVLAQMLREIPYHWDKKDERDIHPTPTEQDEIPGIDEIISYQLEEVQALVLDRIEDGEVELRNQAKIFARKYLHQSRTKIIVCNNYYDYFSSLEDLCGLDIDRLVKKGEHLDHDQVRLLRNYLRLKSQDPADQEFIKYYKEKELCIELICSVGNKKGQTRFIGVRKKDMGRTLKKQLIELLRKWSNEILKGTHLKKEFNF